MSRNERSHCPTQTVKKLLEEQRRRQQQPDAGGVPGQFPPPQSQLQPQPPPPPLIPSVNEVEPGKLGRASPWFPQCPATTVRTWGGGLGGPRSCWDSAGPPRFPGDHRLCPSPPGPQAAGILVPQEFRDPISQSGRSPGASCLVCQVLDPSPGCEFSSCGNQACPCPPVPTS